MAELGLVIACADDDDDDEEEEEEEKEAGLEFSYGLHFLDRVFCFAGVAVRTRFSPCVERVRVSMCPAFVTRLSS